MISARAELLDEAAGALEAAFGPIDLASDTMDFDFTHYYDAEMGGPLLRRFVAFERLVSPEALAWAKVKTNEIEAKFAAEVCSPAVRRSLDALTGGLQANPSRPINLDPGYVAPAKLVLASMKNFSHRIYLSQGVYAEVTLMFHKTGWEALAWTFPDYATPRYHGFLTRVRQTLIQQTQEAAQ